MSTPAITPIPSLLDDDPLSPAPPAEAAHALRHMQVQLTICAGTVTHATH